MDDNKQEEQQEKVVPLFKVISSNNKEDKPKDSEQVENQEVKESTGPRTAWEFLDETKERVSELKNKKFDKCITIFYDLDGDMSFIGLRVQTQEEFVGILETVKIAVLT